MLKSGLIVSFFTLISRILGLLRDVITASLLGSGLYADAFFLANRIPNFLRRIFAEGAFAKAFVPVLTEISVNESEQARRDFIAKISGCLGVVVAVVTLLGVIFSSILTALFALGWAMSNDSVDIMKFEQASLLLKITFPYLFFISLVALSGGILNTLGKFSVMAFTPIVLNVMIILTALIAKNHVASPDLALSLGILLGGIMQFLLQIPFLKKVGALVKPQVDFTDPRVKKVGRLMLPAIIGVSVSQLNFLINQIIASFLATGAISYLYYADRLVELPIGVFGIAISTVILPKLARIVKDDSIPAVKKHKDFAKALDWGVKMIFFIAIPATCALATLAAPLILTLFMRGEFSMLSVLESSRALGVMAFSLTSYMLIAVLANGFYAQQNTQTPVTIAMIAAIINLLGATFTLYLDFVGLALASVISSMVNALLLYRALHKKNIYTISGETLMFLVKVIIATSLVLAFLLYARGDIYDWQPRSLGENIINLSKLIFSGGAIYLISLLIQGIRWQDFKGEL